MRKSEKGHSVQQSLLQATTKKTIENILVLQVKEIEH